jgi:hypothetical protein
MCSSITFRVSCRTWLSVLALGRVVLLLRPVPVPAGRLLADCGGLGAVPVANELSGSAAEAGFGSGREADLVVSAGGLVAVDVCSLATSAKGVRGCLGAKNGDALPTAGFGAGLV